MRRTLLSDFAARDNARVTMTMESTSADGEPQVVTLEGPQVRTLERGLTDDQRRARAWRRNRSCCSCGQQVPTPKDAGVLSIDGVDRIAHKRGGCFASAIVEHCTTVATVTALGALPR